MAGKGGQRMAELLRGPEQLPISVPVCRPPDAAVASISAPKITEGPLHMDGPRDTASRFLAQAGNPTPLAEPTLCRQHYPREEPDALTGTSGSARGVSSNGDLYRD